MATTTKPTPTPTPSDEVLENIDDPLAGLEVTQYELSDFEANAMDATVTYTDDDGLIYKRQINVPKNKDGSVNQEYLDEILYSQLLGVNTKRSIGVAVFKDASEYEETTPEEEAPT